MALLFRVAAPLLLTSLLPLSAASPAPQPTTVPALLADRAVAVTTTSSSTQTCITQGAHIMVAPGCGQPCGTGTPGLIGPLVASVSAAIPGSDEYYVPYTNSTNQQSVSTPLMERAFDAYVNACPNVPIIFIGYSLGGVIIMNTMCGGVPAQYAPHVIAAILYGEETRVANQSWNYGSCNKSAPLYARANSFACKPFGNAIRSWCDLDDPQCCTNGTNPAAHFAYPSRYGQMALAYATSAFYAKFPNTTLPNTPIGATSSSTVVTVTTVTTTITSLPTTSSTSKSSTTTSSTSSSSKPTTSSTSSRSATSSSSSTSSKPTSTSSSSSTSSKTTSTSSSSSTTSKPTSTSSSSSSSSSTSKPTSTTTSSTSKSSSSTSTASTTVTTITRVIQVPCTCNTKLHPCTKPPRKTCRSTKVTTKTITRK